MTRPRCVGVVLAGGRAARFAEAPKGLETIGGVRSIDRVARALAESCDELLLVANAPHAGEWLPGVRVVSDAWHDRGPVGGIATALRSSDSAVLVVAWDMPFVPSALCIAVRASGEREPPNDGPIVADEHETNPAIGRALLTAPWSRSPFGAEPLCAYYDLGAREAIERLLTDGASPAAHRLFTALPTAVLPRAQVEAMGDPDVMFLSVNTPMDLCAAREIADRATRGTPQ